MISMEAVEAYTTRLTVDVSNIERLTPSQRDTVKSYGSQAEALLLNRDLAQFIHHYKFQMADALTGITGHSADDNAQRVAIANNITGIDQFVTSLKRAIYYKNKVLAWEKNPAQTKSINELKQVFDPNQ